MRSPMFVDGAPESFRAVEHFFVFCQKFRTQRAKVILCQTCNQKCSSNNINWRAIIGQEGSVEIINAKSKNIDTAKEFYAFALSVDGQKAIDSYSGFPVNKERFDASLVDPDAGTEGYDPNESKGSWGMTDEDGNEISVDSYWPTDDQIAQLKNLIDSLDTPSYGDYTILSTILKDSMNAIIGDTSVDDAVEQVV